MALNASATQRTSSEGCRLPFDITPSDTVDCAPSRGLHANTTGWIRITGTEADDDTYVERYVLAGVIYPYWVKRVWATNTNAPIASVGGLT